MKNKINTIIKNASEKGVAINFKEENIIDHIWNDNVVGSIEYKGFKGVIYQMLNKKTSTSISRG